VSIESILLALVGLAGIAVGAWLNSALALRRERWHLKRDLYTRLQEGLLESRLRVVWLRHDHTPENFERVRAGTNDLTRVGAVAAVILPDRICTILDTIGVHWATANMLKDKDETLRRWDRDRDKTVKN